LASEGLTGSLYNDTHGAENSLYLLEMPWLLHPVFIYSLLSYTDNYSKIDCITHNYSKID